jgi:hypothetical protein
VETLHKQLGNPGDKQGVATDIRQHCILVHQSNAGVHIRNLHNENAPWQRA